MVDWLVRGEGWGWGVSLTDVDLDSHIRDKQTLILRVHYTWYNI